MIGNEIQGHQNHGRRPGPFHFVRVSELVDGPLVCRIKQECRESDLYSCYPFSHVEDTLRLRNVLQANLSTYLACGRSLNAYGGPKQDHRRAPENGLSRLFGDAEVPAHQNLPLERHPLEAKHERERQSLLEVLSQVLRRLQVRSLNEFTPFLVEKWVQVEAGEDECVGQNQGQAEARHAQFESYDEELAENDLDGDSCNVDVEGQVAQACTVEIPPGSVVEDEKVLGKCCVINVHLCEC